MRDADNDNEKFPFKTLAAVTAGVLSKLAEKQNEERTEDGRSSQDHERAAREQREYIEQRLREIAAFERRARGYRNPLR